MLAITLRVANAIQRPTLDRPFTLRPVRMGGIVVIATETKKTFHMKFKPEKDDVYSDYLVQSAN